MGRGLPQLALSPDGEEIKSLHFLLRARQGGCWLEVRDGPGARVLAGGRPLAGDNQLDLCPYMIGSGLAWIRITGGLGQMCVSSGFSSCAILARGTGRQGAC